MRQKFLLGGLLAIVCIITAAAFWPVLSARAVSFDDDLFLTDYNPLVQRPSLNSAWRILTEVLSPSSAAGYYQPLSVISIMLDYAAGGNAKNLEPFHRTNLILHILNTALLIVLLYIIFGQAVPAAMAGLLFGIHPLTVEPIAWISDRKTLLAMFFALWCLIFYVRYARPAACLHKQTAGGFYIACMVMYVLAMMSKPTSLPLSIALLVMDYWPLNRIAENLKRNTIFEKLPFFALGGVFTLIAMISNARTVSAFPVEPSAKIELTQIPFVMCYLISFYLNKIILPVRLSSVYPLPQPLALSNPEILVGVIITAIVVIVLLYSARYVRVFLGGGLFFLVVIFPTLGLVRFSPWVVASDKYVYMPAIGLMMILAWCFGRVWQTAKQKFESMKTVSIALVLLLSAGEVYGLRQYLIHWRESVTLYEYMLKLTPNEEAVYVNLGVAYSRLGCYRKAIEAYKQALKLKPHDVCIFSNLGTVYARLGCFPEAIEAFKQTIFFNPDCAEVYYNLSIVYNKLGRYQDAIESCTQAIKIKPDYADAYYNLGAAYAGLGRFPQAVDAFKQTTRINPDHFNAYYNLGVAYGRVSRYSEAIDAFKQTMKIKPDYADAHYNLGLCYLMIGDKGSALQEYGILKTLNTKLADELFNSIHK